MFSPTPRGWLGQRRPSRNRKQPSPRPIRLGLEALEDRCLLSAGQLDPTFGTGGQVVVPPFVGPGDDMAAAAVLQPDGMLIVGGTSSNGVGRAIALARYDAAGHLDSTFGAGGRVKIPFGTGSDQLGGLALQADGKIIVAGSATGSPILARFNADGCLDGTFGRGGIASADFAATAGPVALQSDGKILVACVTASAEPVPAVARFSADGSLDQTFGSGGETTFTDGSIHTLAVQPDGKILVDVPGGSQDPLVRLLPDGGLDDSFHLQPPTQLFFGPPSSLAVQPDGSFLVAGGIDNSRFPLVVSDNWLSSVVRYTADGTADSTFGSGGVTSFGGLAAAIAVQSDGKILTVDSNAMLVRRFLADGSADPGFGDGGAASSIFSAAGGQALAVTPGGQIVAAGSSQGDFAVARLNADGSPDASFGTGGGVATDFPGPLGLSTPREVLLPDGRLVVAANAFAGSTYSSFLTRYNGDGSPDTGFGNGGRVSTDFGGSAYRWGIVAVAPAAGGKLLIGGLSDKSLLLRRLNPDGSVDTSYGAGGTVTVATATGSLQSFVSVSTQFQPDGESLVAYVINQVAIRFGGLPEGFYGLHMGRYDPDGRPETTIDGGTSLSGQRPFLAAAPGGNGQIVLVSSLGDDPSIVSRYNADGSPDTSFGDNGMVRLESVGDVSSAAVQPDGKIVVAANVEVVADNGRRSFLVRYNPDGSPDAGFGSGGMVISNMYTWAVSILPDGVLLAASSVSKLDPVLTLVAYGTDGSPDPAFGNAGTVGTALKADASSIVTEADGKILVVGANADNGTTLSVERYTAPDATGVPGVLGLPEQPWLVHLYRDILHRPLDAVGLAAWGGFLSAGHSRAEVIAGVYASEEYRTQTVARLYNTLLKRPPDPEGLQTFVAFMGQGGTESEVEALLLGSPEYYINAAVKNFNPHVITNPPDSNATFLDAVYGDAFHRPVDNMGEMLFTQALTAGADRATIVAAVVGSLEYQRVWVQRLYSQYLHRSADDVGLAAFASALQQGVSPTEILAQLLTSEEYVAQP
jgi:uncharacterized delta-60 repeat protein